MNSLNGTLFNNIFHHISKHTDMIRTGQKIAKFNYFTKSGNL